MTSVACSDSNNNSPRPANGDQGGFEQTTPGTIVDEATKAGVFNTLLAAAGAAELVDALNGDGPLTVFAPTDDAFAALPEGTVETLLLPENKKMLQDILLYHVVSGEVLAQQAISLAGNNSMVATLQGDEIELSLNNGDLFINESQVITADVIASNGVIHVINQVLLPPMPTMNIVETAINAGSFNTLVAAVQAADLVDALQGPGPLTVFAPTDAAFAALPVGTVETLLKPENKQQLTDILLYHVVAGSVVASDLEMKKSLETLFGQDVMVEMVDGELIINKSKIIIKDIKATNGVIQVIDAVLLP